jgi:hypothetical protein
MGVKWELELTFGFTTQGMGVGVIGECCILFTDERYCIRYATGGKIRSRVGTRTKIANRPPP